MSFEFDPIKHIYRLDGKIIPSVTQIISELLPQYNVPEWYLQRGSAVHKAAAYIALGVDFEYDDRIKGQVAAIRKFLAEVRPLVAGVEKKIVSIQYRYGGTYDLYAKVSNKNCLIDYKSSISIDRVGIQLGGYSLAMFPIVVNGIGVQINEDGTYSMTKPIKLDNYRREFLALRATYAVRERLGLNKKQED